MLFWRYHQNKFLGSFRLNEEDVVCFFNYLFWKMQCDFLRSVGPQTKVNKRSFKLWFKQRCLLQLMELHCLIDVASDLICSQLLAWVWTSCCLILNRPSCLILNWSSCSCSCSRGVDNWRCCWSRCTGNRTSYRSRSNGSGCTGNRSSYRSRNNGSGCHCSWSSGLPVWNSVDYTVSLWVLIDACLINMATWTDEARRREWLTEGLRRWIDRLCYEEQKLKEWNTLNETLANSNVNLLTANFPVICILLNLTLLTRRLIKTGRVKRQKANKPREDERTGLNLNKFDNKINN